MAMQHAQSFESEPKPKIQAPSKPKVLQELRESSTALFRAPDPKSRKHLCGKTTNKAETTTIVADISVTYLEDQNPSTSVPSTPPHYPRTRAPKSKLKDVFTTDARSRAPDVPLPKKLSLIHI